VKIESSLTFHHFLFLLFFFTGILKFILGSAKEEDLTLNHKPFNPIIGEVHKSRIDHEDGSHTYVLCEQVTILFLFFFIFY